MGVEKKVRNTTGKKAWKRGYRECKAQEFLWGAHVAVVYLLFGVM